MIVHEANYYWFYELLKLLMEYYFFGVGARKRYARSEKKTGNCMPLHREVAGTARGILGVSEHFGFLELFKKIKSLQRF